MFSIGLKTEDQVLLFYCSYTKMLLTYWCVLWGCWNTHFKGISSLLHIVENGCENYSKNIVS